jgi:CTP synthase (UTP-ammonia lyase)
VKSDAKKKKMQALLHASVDCRRKLVVDWVASTDLEDSTKIEVRVFFFFCMFDLGCFLFLCDPF